MLFRSTCPIYQQIVDWFRDKHNKIISIEKDYYDGKCLGFCGKISSEDDVLESETFETYYEAFNATIEKAFNLI